MGRPCAGGDVVETVSVGLLFDLDEAFLFHFSLHFRSIFSTLVMWLMTSSLGKQARDPTMRYRSMSACEGC